MPVNYVMISFGFFFFFLFVIILFSSTILCFFRLIILKHNNLSEQVRLPAQKGIFKKKKKKRMRLKSLILSLMLLGLCFEGYREMTKKGGEQLSQPAIDNNEIQQIKKKEKEKKEKSVESIQINENKINNWYNMQVKTAPEWVIKTITETIKTKGSCAEGFKHHYSTPLDPNITFKPDYMSLLIQLKLYLHQFCETTCRDTLFQYSRTFQGLGSRYHTHLCSLENALRYNKNFISLNGQWLFADSTKCRESNDQCYFKKISKCPLQFCNSAKNSGQDCRMMMHLPEGTVEKCDANCLCGKCGSSQGQHETVWGKHSCATLTDAPLKMNITLSSKEGSASNGDSRSHLWWSSQLLFFLMQPGDELLSIIKSDMASSEFIADPNDVINIHVRRGRLKQPEMSRFFDLQEYKQIAVKRFGKKKIFIQTNDPIVINETTESRNSDIKWGYTEWNRTGKDLQIHNDPKKYKRRKAAGMLVDPKAWTMHSFRNLWLMLRSKYWVCTYSSNWCRLALRLAFATYGALPDTLSLDEWSFDPYKWYTNDYVNNIVKNNLG